ncbi:TetR/AcrR family transcriptional regulator [Streptomyces sp. NPDC019937]|uniref:TetR/AcrR family transcriptional regulator n=1 Tax=Streptomyces sp. NPDC019937 TaxID=3154787 RepID=UPI0033FCD50C
MATARRERYRQQTREEAKAVALTQLAESGTAGISVNAIAKAMGMTGPALYRYFAGRDELLTELITDAYRELAAVAVAAAEAADGAAPADRFRALAHALRDWAKRQPDRYLLIYGTPVPGYQAPPETTESAGTLMRTILDACAALDRAAEPTPLEAELARQLEGVPPWAPGPEPDGELKSRALATWTRLHGVISLEVQGQFSGMGFDPAALFEAEIGALVRGA